MNMRIAMGLKKDYGIQSKIVALGAAKLIGIYDPSKDNLEVLSRKDCGDCISAIDSLDIEALYQPIPKICPTIKEKAQKRGIKLMTGTCETVKAMIEHLCELKEME
jgi:hypothetical protein